MYSNLQPKVQPVTSLMVDTANREERARSVRMATAWRRYLGEWEDPLLPTDTDPKGTDNTKVNMARKTVDISAYYLFGKETFFEVDGETESDADKWLEECWQSQVDGKMPMLLEFATSAGITGDGFIRVYDPDPAQGEQYPRIDALDAQNVTVKWDPTNYRRVLEYRISFTGIDDDNKPVAYRHIIRREGAKWRIIEQESRSERASYIEIANDLWKYDFCPIFHCKNRPSPNAFYGTSDIEEDVLGINKAINVVLSNNNRILRNYAHPTQWIAGQSLKDKIDRSVGNILYLPNHLATIGQVEPVTELTASFEQHKLLMEAYHELTSVPEIASGKFENVGQLSGLALQILYGPLLALTNVKQMLYGHMLSTLCKSLLKMGGFAVKVVKVQWGNVLPKNKQEEASTAITLQDAGVSRDTALTEMGYDAEDEAEKKKDEAQSIGALAVDAFNSGNTGDTNNVPPDNEEE